MLPRIPLSNVQISPTRHFLTLLGCYKLVDALYGIQLLLRPRVLLSADRTFQIALDLALNHNLRHTIARELVDLQLSNLHDLVQC